MGVQGFSVCSEAAHWPEIYASEPPEKVVSFSSPLLWSNRLTGDQLADDTPGIWDPCRRDFYKIINEMYYLE